MTKHTITTSHTQHPLTESPYDLPLKQQITLPQLIKILQLRYPYLGTTLSLNDKTQKAQLIIKYLLIISSKLPIPKDHYLLPQSYITRSYARLSFSQLVSQTQLPFLKSTDQRPIPQFEISKSFNWTVILQMVKRTTEIFSSQRTISF